MRLLELILALAVAASGIRLAAVGRTSGWIHGMQLLLAVLLVAQVLVEGWRWQMAPAYIATVAIAVTPNLAGLGASALLASVIVSIALLGLSILSCLLLPFVEPRTAHGPFAVGVTDLSPDAVRRPEIGPDELTAAPLVRLWYPAEAPGWVPRFQAAVRQRISDRFRAAPTTPATTDAAVARTAAKLPTIIYFDGWPEDKIQNVNLILELASRGYLVSSVQYPPRLDRPMVAYSSDADFEHSVQMDHARARAHARDATAVLNVLTAFETQTGNRFAHRLAPQRAATLGFSFGGAIAAEASRLDPRIRAVVNMDGRHWGDALEHGVEKPYLFICEELAMPTAADLASSDPMTRYEARLDQADYSKLAANLQALGGIRVTIAGMTHLNFTDVPLRSPLRRLSGGGRIEAGRAQEIIRTYVLEFFSRYLMSEQPPPLNSPLPQLAEVRLQSWPAPPRMAAQ